MKNIPVICITKKTLAEGYEAALLALYNEGTRFKTQYDKPGDPPSIDATLNLTILEPEIDPMIHQAFPGGIDELKEYVLELKGYKDHWVKNMNDPADTRWEYTYHGRLAKYGCWQEIDANGKSKQVGFSVDQVWGVIEKLVKQPFTRQAQMITWMPNVDLKVYDPPCLQSLWYRIMEEDDGSLWLNCNIRFRSNDAWGASFMNMFGFIQFNREVIAYEVGKELGKEIHMGRLNWQADSYHIYGRDIAKAKSMLFDRIDSMSFEERIMEFNNEFIRQMYDDAQPRILSKIEEHDRSH